MSEDVQALTGVETTTFDDLEQVIEKGLATFVEVGQALQRIRDGKLYREGFATFEDYLRDRWGLSRSYGYQKIDAAKIAGTLSAIADTPAPANEAVARELAPLKDEPEQVQQAWQETVQEHGPKPTAGQVREVVKRKTKPTAKQPGEDQALPTHAQLPAEGLGYEEPDGEELAGFLREEIPEAVSSLVADLNRAASDGEAVAGGLRELLDEASKLDLDLGFVDLTGLVQARQQLNELINAIEAAVRQSLHPGDEDADDTVRPVDDLPEGWTLAGLEAVAAEHEDVDL